MAMTDLSAQLRTIVLSHGGPAPRHLPKGRPSLLFSPREAADIDLQTIYNIALTGYNELSAADGRFEPFGRTLFGHESLQLDRELEAPDVNSRLDGSISSFLQLLSGYLLLTPAHQMLEYLIRRYKVQKYNVEDLMACVLPYHDTNLFVRIVQLLHLQGTRWAFLDGVQKNGAAVPRDVLALRCSRDPSLLEAVCNIAKKVSQPAARGHISIAFCTVLIMDALATAPAVNDAHVAHILPFILDALGRPAATQEYQAGALMVVAQLANRTELSPALLDALVEALTKPLAMEVSLPQERLMLLLQLTQTQSMTRLSLDAFHGLMKMDDLAARLVDLSCRFDTTKFLSLLLDCLAQNKGDDPACERLFMDVVQNVPLEAHVGHVIELLLSRCLPSPSEGDATAAADEQLADRKQTAKRVMRTLERRFPAQFDSALNKALQSDMGPKKSLKKGATAAPGGQGGALLTFLQEALPGSFYCPLAESNATLHLSIDHPQAWVRNAAVRQLAVLAQDAVSSGDKQVLPFAREALLRRLQDDDWNVVGTTLKVEALPELLPPGTLISALEAVLMRAMSAATAGPRKEQGDARVVAKLVLDLLARPVLHGSSHDSDRACALLMAVLLVRPKVHKLSHFALKAASGLSWPLFNHLDKVVTQLDMQPAQWNEKVTKVQRAAANAETNDKVLQALAQSVLADPVALLPLLGRVLEGSRQLTLPPLVALVLMRCLQSALTEHLAALLAGALPVLKSLFVKSSLGASLSMPDLAQVDYKQWTASPPAHVYLALEAAPLLAELVVRMGHLMISKAVEAGAVAGDLSKQLFIAVAGSWARSLLQEQLACLIAAATGGQTLPFLTALFTAVDDNVPVGVKVCSLELLALHYKEEAAVAGKGGSRTRGPKGTSRGVTAVQTGLPALLIALNSPIKGVRRGALNCVSALSSLAETLDQTGVHGNAAQPGGAYNHLLASLMEDKAALISDTKHLPVLLGKALGTPSHGSGNLMEEDGPPQELVAAQSTVVRHLASQVLEQSEPGLQVALLSSLVNVGHSWERAVVTWPLLSGLLERRKLHHVLPGAMAAASGMKVDGQLSSIEVQLLVLLLKVYAPEAASQVEEQGKQKKHPCLADMLEALQVAGGSSADPAVTEPALAAVSVLQAGFCSALSQAGQEHVFGALVTLAGNDDGANLRSMARDCLHHIQFKPAVVAKHLIRLATAKPPGDSTTTAAETPAKRKKKTTRGKAADIAGSDGAIWPPEDRLLPCATVILELLMSQNDDVSDRSSLVASLQTLLGVILAGHWPLQASSLPCKYSENEEEGEASAAKEASLAVTYVHQLILMVLANIATSFNSVKDGVERPDAAVFDADLAVRCITSATDPATRNYATGLLTAVAQLQPERVLRHVLTVLQVMGASTLTQDDSQSHRAAQQMVAAVVPAWLAHFSDLPSLLQVFVDALPQVPLQRRLPLVTGVLRVVTEAKGLPEVLLLLLRLHLSQCTGEKGMLPGGLSSSRQLVVEAGEDDWVLDFADQLCGQYAPVARLLAFVRLLGASREGAGRDAVILQGLALQVVVQHLQSRAFWADIPEEPLPLMAESTPMQDAYVALLEQVLLQLRGTGGVTHGPAASPLKGQKGVVDVAYSLLGVLNDLMAPEAYLRGVKALICHPDSLVRQKVLRLVANKVREGSEAQQVSRRQRRSVRQKQLQAQRGRGDKEAQLAAHQEESSHYAELAVAAAGLLTGPDEDESGSTKLAALQALGVVARKYAEGAPAAFVACLPAAAAGLGGGSRPIMVAAAQCLGELVTALGPVALPKLPHFMPALLSAAHAAAQALPVQRYAELLPKEAIEDITSIETEEGGEGDAGAETTLQQEELLAELLGALKAVLAAMGSFLSPHLKEIVALLVLHPAMHTYHNGKAGRQAAAIRELLAKKIPARLLLDPLCSAYGAAVAAGPAPTAALLEVLASVTGCMDRSAVASYHGRIFDFLVGTFDLRRKLPAFAAPVGTGSIVGTLPTVAAEEKIELPGLEQAVLRSPVEQASIHALAGLVMKLSENTFKPLFVQLMDWAQAEVVDGEVMPPGGSIDRNIILYGVAGLLTDRLRSVFVPYFRYLLDSCVLHLSGQADEGAMQGGEPPKKKKKVKGRENSVADCVLSPARWQLRFLVVAALRKCFLFDTVGFLDAARFQRLLQPLTMQIGLEPVPSSEEDCVPSRTTMDEELVACLGQMALTANSDTLWKPLNYQVLMCTRSQNVRARLTALAVIAFLVDRIKEEYLVLLPETIPFLAELLEDTNLTVVARTQGLVKTLEVLSGEELSQYF